MSYELTAWAVAVERPEDAGADWSTVKLTLITMTSFADAHGRECYASVATIAGRIGVSPATTKRALVSLKKWGLIVVAEQQTLGGTIRFRFADGSCATNPGLGTQVTDDLTALVEISQ